MNLLKLCLLAFLGRFGTTEAQSDVGYLHMNPCHPGEVQGEPGERGCDQISLPPGFCSSCKINDFDEYGRFSDCWVTMKLEEPTCISAMQEYVDMNPCDQNRANTLNDWLYGSGDVQQLGRLKMDWFMFSICEQGCDCIPMINADRSTPAYDFSRGNCQAHAYYHICRLLPDIKKVKLADGSPDEDLSNLPHVCDSVTDWFNSPASEDWVEIPTTFIEPHVEDFLDGFMEAKQLSDLPEFWESCFDLEVAQRRIQELGTYRIYEV